MRRKWWRCLGIALAVIVAVAGVTARLFVWPTQGAPARVDAIVMLNSPGDPLTLALRLAHQGRARFLVVSQGGPGGGYQCPPAVPHVRLICFIRSRYDPRRGGVCRAAGRRYHWHSLLVVTTVSQASRARLRVERCFAGHLYLMAAPIPPGSWPYQLAYQWAATIKALAVQRGC